MNENKEELVMTAEVVPAKEEVKVEPITRSDPSRSKVMVKTNKSGVQEAELVKENRNTIIVRLPDGHIIKRKKTRMG